jgi:hypothetical protein
VEVLIDFLHEMHHMRLMRHDRMMGSDHIHNLQLTCDQGRPPQAGVRLDPLGLGQGMEDDGSP